MSGYQNLPGGNQPYPPSYPPQPGYVPTYSPQDSEASTLSTLSILWYILAGLQCIPLLIGLFYMVLGVLFFLGITTAGHDAGAAGAGAVVGGMFLVIGVLLGGLGATLSFLSFLVGKSLKQRRRHTLCFVMGCLICLSIPLGTALGIFTLVTLSKPQVKASFT